MISVSNYHYIRENFKTDYPSIFGLTPYEFKNQLKKIKNSGDFINPVHFINNFEDLVNSKDNYFFITFDDGLKEQFEFAVPILDEFNTQAIYFATSINSECNKVCTVHKIHLLRSILKPQDLLNYLELNKIDNLSIAEQETAKTCYRFDDVPTAKLKYLLNFKIPFELQEKLIDGLFKLYFSEKEVCESLYMTNDQLHYLAQNNCLGSHTHSHYPLGLLDDIKLHYELNHSKTYLENLTSSKINMIAYPYGTPEACDDRIAEEAKKAGYIFGFTTQKGNLNNNPTKLLLNRFDCNDLIGGKNFI